MVMLSITKCCVALPVIVIVVSRDKQCLILGKNKHINDHWIGVRPMSGDRLGMSTE